MKICNIHASREGTVVLDGVTFDVDAGVTAILGRSGIGKTTLLRIIAGLDRPERGEVTDMSPRDVGVVFQNYPLIRHRTVEDNLFVAARVGGLDAPRARKRAEEMLARVGLEDRADFYPAQLSGGQRQRAAIAQQLVMPKRLLLLDEPFSGLDPGALADVCDLVTEVAKEEDHAVIVVTHDIRAALAVSHRVVLLDVPPNGRGARVVSSEVATPELEREITRRFRRAA